MKRIETSILYVDENDLRLEARSKNIEDINYHDLKEKQVMIKESVVILKIGFNYKVLKSRY